MIHTYREIGKSRMYSDGYVQMSPAEQKKYILRQFCAEDEEFAYQIKRADGTREDMVGRMIQMNLDTIKKQITFSRTFEISEGKSSEYMIFKNYAPNDPNIYGTQKAYKSILSFALLDYIVRERKDIAWTKPEELDKCIEYLQNIRDDYFVNDEVYGLRPNYLLLSDEQQEGFPDPDLDDDLRELSKAKDIKKRKETLTENYFKRHFADYDRRYTAYSITIDGKYIHEVEEIAAFNFDVLYYYLIDKLFDGKVDGNCHICGNDRQLAKEVMLKQKFYGTTNKFYFDNTKNTRSYSSFSMCEQCFKEITVGTEYSRTRLTTRLLNLNCLILPEFEQGFAKNKEDIDPVQIKKIVRLIERQSASDRYNNLNTMHNLERRIKHFSLFFFFKPKATSQEFIVNKLINSVHLPSLLQKSEDLANLTMEHSLPKIFNINDSMSFEDLRYLVLPSIDSHENLKPYEYQKINRDIINFLSAYLYSQKIDYDFIIKNFVNIFARKFNRLGKKSDYALKLSPYLLSLYFKHLNNFNMLKGLRSKEEKPMTTKLENKDILEYFQNHPQVYENNYLAQGLFILGWFLARLEYAQKKKGINRTAIHKLNLRGMPLQKIKSFMATIDELRLVWKVPENKLLEAYYRECMNYAETSIMAPEEVIYHILGGRAYNSYLGILKGKEHAEAKQNENENQEVQDD